MLLYFILGALFVYLGLPLMQNLLSIIQAMSEYVVYIFAGKVYKIKKQIMPQGQQQEQTSNPIGFVYTDAIGTQVESHEEYSQDEEEE